jgi:sugar (pentulose or hexulose) kinase
MTAAVGVKAFDGYPEAAAEMTSLASVVSPRPELAQLYTRRYGTYKELRERAIQIWAQSRTSRPRGKGVVK